jgi:hypothetical protein
MTVILSQVRIFELGGRGTFQLAGKENERAPESSGGD